MAKKKEEKLSYLQVPLPSGRKSYRIAKRSWTGINYRHTIDSGELSMAKNISTLEAPCLVPSKQIEEDLDVEIDLTLGASASARAIGLFGFGDVVIYIYRSNSDICVKWARYYGGDLRVYTGYLQKGGATEADEYPRQVVQFNVYDNPTDPVKGKYVKKLLIFPDRMSMDLEPDDGDLNLKSMDSEMVIKKYDGEEGALPPDSASHNYYYQNKTDSKIYQWVDDEGDSSKSCWTLTIPPTFPPIEYATVHLSRLFGVGNGRVYASGFNNYANWSLDTVDEYNESNAWCSPAEANTKASGEFTGITTFQNHVICFKRDFMHEIYNTKNPFRIQDVFAEGTIDQRTIQEVDGKLIFVSDEGVKIYTGSNPRDIGYKLNTDRLDYAVSGTDGRCYYLYREDRGESDRLRKRLFVYDTFTDAWSEEYVARRILSFAMWQNGLYLLYDNGWVYKWEGTARDWAFETDLITNETVNIKHIKKMQMLAEVGEYAYFNVYFLYDEEEFDSLSYAEQLERLVYSSSGEGRVAVRVKPRKTANYGVKLHIDGSGYVKFHELELFIENGGGLYTESGGDQYGL